MLKIKGFTLVELLVVIAIIAVLSVAGVAVYSGLQKNARDARRKADIVAIAQAMEAQRVPGATTYPLLATSFFSAGVFPIDPLNTLSGATAACPSACRYCFTMSSTAITSCPASGGNYIDTNSTFSPSGSWTTSATWTVCANLEGGGSSCRSNAQ